jgi:hypothetical protein
LKDKVFVNLSHTDQPDLSKLTLVLVGLAFCVFTWGLQYKLSLYDAPHSISHRMPAAKLLSRDEQATVAESLLLQSTRASGAIGRDFLLHVSTCVLPAFGPLGTPESSQAERESKRPWRIFRRPGLTTFFYRPPPSLS